MEVEEKGKEGVSGKKGEGRETCLNTVGKKALLEFKVKNSPPPPNTWSCGQIGTNGI